MRKNLLKVTLMMIVALMLVGLVGCSKTEKNQIPTSGDGKQEEAGEEQGATGADASEASKMETKEENAEETEAVSEQETVVVFDGIKDVYEQYGIMSGTCLSDIMISQTKYSDIIKKNFNSITLENNMKPDAMLDRTESIASGDIVVTFTKRTTDLLDWAKSNGMSVRGHVLVWYSQTPDWIFYQDFDKTKGLVDRDTMLARMESYIKQVFEKLDELGYSDMFYAYDVVNEAIMEDGSYRECLWKQIIGDDYIWHAFNYADKYAPEHIKLYYNDYNEQFKTDYIVKLAESLVDETGRTLIDGIGCQAHLYTKDSIDQYMNTLKAFSATGLDVQITELDVSLGTWTNILTDTDENLKDQGKYYYELISRIIKENEAGNTNISSLTFWGFVDNLSWRRERSPLLLDSNLNAKYAYFGAMLDEKNAGY